MKFARAFIVTLAILLAFERSAGISCNGCCSDNVYTKLNNPRRSINSIWKYGQQPLCDRNLPWGWYRFTSYVGGQMPSSLVRPNHCGTVAPIWIKGKHPSVKDGAATRKACINFFGWRNGCAQSFNITIRNCSSFYVYFLRPTYSCALAYCAGKIFVILLLFGVFTVVYCM